MAAGTTDTECPNCEAMIDLPASFCSSCGERIHVTLEVEGEDNVEEDIGVPSPWYWLFLVSIPVYMTVNAVSFLTFGFSTVYFVVLYLLIIPMVGMIHLDINRLEEAGVWEEEGSLGYILMVLLIPATGLIYLYLRNKRVFPDEGPSVSRSTQFVIGVLFGSLAFGFIPIITGLIAIGLGVSIMRYEYSKGRGVYLVLLGIVGMIVGIVINFLHLYSGM